MHHDMRRIAQTHRLDMFKVYEFASKPEIMQRYGLVRTETPDLWGKEQTPYTITVSAMHRNEFIFALKS